jgi:signal peptidase I
MTWVLFGVAGTAALLLLTRRRYLVVIVEGRSMEPAYRAGERVLVRRARTVRAIQAGQIVVFRSPGVADPYDLPGIPREAIKHVFPDTRLLIKRAVAVPGDPVPRDRIPSLRDVPESAVPLDRFIVLGDNPAVSFDSREYGYLRGEHLVGVALRKVTLR